ncbi:MAG: ribonuclease activity regulator RraA [Candidatus Limnocylindrales bacterium]
MHGPDFSRPTRDIIETLARGSTASITSVMRENGIENCWMDIKPLIPGSKIVGPAVTIRTVPGRGDIEPNAHTPGTLYPRHPEEAIDAVQPGDVVVQDGGPNVRGGIFGDLLTLRLEVRRAAGLVTDMPIRDSPRVRKQPVPIFARATQAPGSHVFNPDFNVPIGCAGVLVFPGDIIVGDDDGVVVIPAHLVGAVIENIEMFEDREDWIRLMLRQGAPLQGLYPPNDEMERRFQTWRAGEEAQATTKRH